MALSEKVTIKPGIWDAATRAHIAQAVDFQYIEDIRRQVETGAARLFVGESESGAHVFSFVLRVDELASGNEGVIMAAAGNLAGVDLTEQVLPIIEKMFHGCASVRIHTERAGLVKKLVRMGWGSPEFILRKDLNG